MLLQWFQAQVFCFTGPQLLLILNFTIGILVSVLMIAMSYKDYLGHQASAYKVLSGILVWMVAWPVALWILWEELAFTDQPSKS